MKLIASWWSAVVAVACVSVTNSVGAFTHDVDALFMVTKLAQKVNEHRILTTEKVLTSGRRSLQGLDLPPGFEDLVTPECNQTLADVFSGAIDPTASGTNATNSTDELLQQVFTCLSDAIVVPIEQCLSQWPSVYAPVDCIISGSINSAEQDFFNMLGSNSNSSENDSDVDSTAGIEQVSQPGVLNATECVDTFGTGENYQPLACAYVFDLETININELLEFSTAAANNFSDVNGCEVLNLVLAGESVDDSSSAPARRRELQGDDSSDPTEIKEVLEQCEEDHDLGVVTNVDKFSNGEQENSASNSQMSNILIGFSVFATLWNK